jgi:heme-degrading monooxygenase HmoA
MGAASGPWRLAPEVDLMTIYTLGIWTVKAGREADFVSAWQELADRTKSDFPDETATLLRDRDQPRQFVSFGPWQSLEQIDQWRGSDTFKQGVAKLQELLDEFAPHTMDLEAQIL